jgi:cobalt-zinc-cadmium resistance protein CzcA
MIEGLVRGALKQRLVIVVIAFCLLAFGLDATRKLSVDAFPTSPTSRSRSPPRRRPFAGGSRALRHRAPRNGMTGLPGLIEMRSLNKPGLSLITLVFTDKTDLYFARQLVMERLHRGAAAMPAGVTPVLGPVSTGLGEVYQYTLERPTTVTARAHEVDELTEAPHRPGLGGAPLLRSIPGVAEINSQGGYVKQYQVLVHPDRLRHYHGSRRPMSTRRSRNNANCRRRRPAASQRAVPDPRARPGAELDDIRRHRAEGSRRHAGLHPRRGRGEDRHAVRVGALVKNGVTEAVGGIVMMLAGGNAKAVVPA